LGKGIPVVNFNSTMRVMGSNAAKAWKKQTDTQKFVSFIVFDVISVGGIDSTHLTQEERWEVLDGMKFNQYVVYNPKFPVSKDLYDKLVEAKIEGVILKDIATPYLPGKRSKGWLKVKSAKTFDVVVTGFTEGQGKYVGQIGAIEFSAYGENGLTYVGRCSGMTDVERKWWTESKSIGTVIEIKANELTGSGDYRTPRHPQYQHIRFDKNPSDCTMEQFKA
jgi:bifunctional non-homologous end joining protein LigD